jgi:hypothetical protein
VWWIPALSLAQADPVSLDLRPTAGPLKVAARVPESDRDLVLREVQRLGVGCDGARAHTVYGWTGHFAEPGDAVVAAQYDACVDGTMVRTWVVTRVVDGAIRERWTTGRPNELRMVTDLDGDGRHEIVAREWVPVSEAPACRRAQADPPDSMITVVLAVRDGKLERIGDLGCPTADVVRVTQVDGRWRIARASQ